MPSSPKVDVQLVTHGWAAVVNHSASGVPVAASASSWSVVTSELLDVSNVMNVSGRSVSSTT